MNRLLIDTNILLDAMIPERTGHAAALLLFDEFAYLEADGYICPLSLKDSYYILTKAFGEKAAREAVVGALDLFHIVNVDDSICRIAAQSNEPDFEDGIVRACAESVPVDLIISRDEKAFQRSPLKRLSAQDYIALFTNAEEIKLP